MVNVRSGQLPRWLLGLGYRAAFPVRGSGRDVRFCTSDAQAFERAIDMTDDELAAIVGRAKLTVA